MALNFHAFVKTMELLKAGGVSRDEVLDALEFDSDQYPDQRELLRARDYVYGELNPRAGATPGTLDEAIRNALCVGPLSEVQDRIYLHVRDFLAQRFGAYFLHAEGWELQRLEELFKLIVKREK